MSPKYDTPAHPSIFARRRQLQAPPPLRPRVRKITPEEYRRRFLRIPGPVDAWLSRLTGMPATICSRLPNIALKEVVGCIETVMLPAADDDTYFTEAPEWNLVITAHGPSGFSVGPRSILAVFVGTDFDLSAPEWVRSPFEKYTFREPLIPFVMSFARMLRECRETENEGLSTSMNAWADKILDAPSLMLDLLKTPTSSYQHTYHIATIERSLHNLTITM